MLLRSEFDAVSRQIRDLHVLLNQYTALYSGDDVDAKMTLLSDVAPTFFHWDREIWLDAIFQAISRLMDKVLVARHQTIGVRAIFEKLDDPLKSTLQPLFSEMDRIYTDGIQKWRNNRISHSNREYHLGLSRLPDIPIADVKALVLKFEQLINAISLALYNETGAYFEIEIRNGAEKLLAILKQLGSSSSS